MSPQSFDAGRQHVLVRLIDNQASAAVCDFPQGVVPAANARFAMEKALNDWETESVHQLGVNSESTPPIFAKQPLVADVTQSAERAASHL
jgi:hypothetical protein